MGRFRVTLDGTLLENEPIGLLDTELKIVRDESLKGIFFKYATDITFYGDGYEILRAIDEADDTCAQVSCLIEYQCSNNEPFQTLFEGIVPIWGDDIEWDRTNCMVKTSIEAADFSDLINRYGDFPIKINATKCLDGVTSLAAIDTYTTDFFPGFFGSLTTLDRKTHLFTDVLEQAFSFITNNNVTVSFDSLYSQQYQRQEINVQFSRDLEGGSLGNPDQFDVITTTFTNYWGQEYTIVHTCVSGFGVTSLVDQWMAKLFHIGGTNAQTPAYTIRTNNFEKFSYGESVLSDEANFSNLVPITDITITVTPNPAGGGTPCTATITETQAFQWGLAGLGLVNTTRLQGQASDMYVTLNQLMEHIAQFHNMGYRFIKSGAGYELQIRKVEDLINNTSSGVQLENVNDITSKKSGSFSLTNFATPSGSADSAFRGLYTTGLCFGDNLKVDGERFSSQEFFDVINNQQVQDDKLMFFFFDPSSTTSAASAQAHGFRLTQQIPAQPNGITVLSDGYYHYNAQYFHPFITERYFINMATKNPIAEIAVPATDIFSSCSNCPAAPLINTETKKLRELYTIRHPLTFSQVQDLISNSLDYINFEDGKTNKDGFVKEISIPFKDFVAKFDLYTE